MTAASEIITLAYREANFNAIGEAAPTTTETAEALTLLQSLVDSFHGILLGIRLSPWRFPVNQRSGSVQANFPARNGDDRAVQPEYPPGNSRILAANTDPATVYLQYDVSDGALVEYIDVGHSDQLTLEANGAYFGLTGGEKSVVIDAAGGGGRNAPRRWMYRGDYASWIEITTLDSTSEMVFPTDFDDYFVAALAMRLAPRFGQEPRQVTLMRYQQMEAFIKHRWQQHLPTVAGDIGVPTYQAHDSAWSQGNSGNFASGRAY